MEQVELLGLIEIQQEFAEAKMEIYQLMNYKGQLYKQTAGMTIIQLDLGKNWNQELHLRVLASSFVFKGYWLFPRGEQQG